MFYTGYTAEVDRLSILFSVGLELLRSNLILMFGLVSFFVSPKLPIDHVALCSPSPGVVGGGIKVTNWYKGVVQSLNSYLYNLLICIS